jgi:hypothetical protein
MPQQLQKPVALTSQGWIRRRICSHVTPEVFSGAPLRVTVPVEEVPPVTVAGLKVSALIVGRGGGFTVSVAVREVAL